MAITPHVVACVADKPVAASTGVPVDGVVDAETRGAVDEDTTLRRALGSMCGARSTPGSPVGCCDAPCK